MQAQTKPVNENALWKQKAGDLFPNLRAALEETEPNDEQIENVYQLFFELLPMCYEATVTGDEETAAKIYAFAEWCHYQQQKDLWNAAGVCFYEHLIDEPETLAQIPKRLSPDVFVGVSGLLEWRLGEAAFADLQVEFARFHQIPPNEWEKRIHPPSPVNADGPQNKEIHP